MTCPICGDDGCQWSADVLGQSFIADVARYGHCPSGLWAEIIQKGASLPRQEPGGSTPWRGHIARWPLDLRQAWADLAAAYEADGTGWREAEEMAFDAESSVPC
jgi:hypothetical protein